MARFLTTRQAADLLTEQYEIPVSYRTLEGWRCREVGPAYYKVAGRVMYKEPDLAKWITSSVEKVFTAAGGQP